MQESKQSTKTVMRQVHFGEQQQNQIRPQSYNSIQGLKQKQQHNKTYEEKQQTQELEYQSLSKQTMQKRLEKLIRFINFHNIQESSVWRGKKQILITQFQRILNQNYGYYLSNEQLSCLLKMGNKNQNLKCKDFKMVNLWQQKSSQSNFGSLSDFSIKRPKKTDGKLSKQSQKIANPLSQIKTWHLGKSKSSAYLVRSNIKANTSSTSNLSFQQSKKYSQAKMRSKLQQLKKDIKQSVLQQKWDFIVMAGEMNQWIQQLRKKDEKLSTSVNPFQTTEIQHSQLIHSLRFKVLNTDPIQIIQHNVLTEMQQKIPHVVFVKKYQTLKKKMVKQQNKKNNLKGTVMMVLEDNDKLSRNNLANRLNQRDQQLNFVLLQVIKMKSIFQWQNNILKQAKINS